MYPITMELIPVASKIERILEILIKGPVLERSQSTAVYLTEPSQQRLYLLASSAVVVADYPASLPLDNHSVQESLLLSKIIYYEAEQETGVASSKAYLGQYWMPILATHEGNKGIVIIETTQNKDTQWNDEAFLQMVSHTLANLIESDEGDVQMQNISHAV
ncbi:MAG: hypothetical protein ACJAWL_000870 [Motiliproteus sp.]|jgi:hypothetical protein